jgi:hypothetical protein
MIETFLAILTDHAETDEVVRFRSQPEMMVGFRHVEDALIVSS